MPTLWKVGCFKEINLANERIQEITNMRMNEEKQFLQISLIERYL